MSVDFLECFYFIAKLLALLSLFHTDLPKLTNDVFDAAREFNLLVSFLLDLPVLVIVYSKELEQKPASFEHLTAHEGF